MRKIKKYISIIVAVQLACTSLMPIYATNGTQKDANNVYSESLNDSKSDNRLIIKFKDDKSKIKFKKSKKQKIKNKVKDEKDLKLKNKKYSIVTVKEDEKVDELIQSISDEYSNEIEMVQPDYLISSFSNTSYVDTDSADTVEESVLTVENNAEEVLVAVIDTAMDYDHEALVNSVYTNSQEVADGVDNDENGYVDDIIGWDFINSTDISQSELTSNHGTHISGIIAADGIGAGINAKILPLNVFNDGLAYTSDIIAAIEYAEQAGAKIANCSWGSTDNNPALEEAISNSEMLFVCAVGNRGANIDETPIYPASYELDNIISVGASNDRDYLAYFSDYGYNVDVVANGYKVRSTLVNNQYGTMMGTSMSAAYVSGVAVRVYNGSAVDTKKLILDTSDKIDTLEKVVNSGRRINCKNALNGIVNDNIIENTNIDYDEERYNEIAGSHDGYELLDLDPEPAQIYAGEQHSLVVDSWGLVKSYGDDTYNQLGNKNTEGTNPYNGTVLGVDYVEKASTFANHNLVLINGEVYAWGQNDFYQLGHTSGTSNAVPTKVEFFNEDGTIPTIVDISAGGWFSIALDNEGNVWAWGSNKYGQFADGATGTQSATPRIIMTGVSKVSAGKYHVLAIKDGTVYGWGRSANEYTIGENAEYSQSTPIEISGLTGTILDIEAGDRCSFFITSDGVYALGANENGQLGTGTNTDISTPTLLDILSVQEIQSNGTTMFLTTNGDVYACGQNTYGQLGQGYSNTRYTEPAKIPGDNYDKISAGGLHNLLYKCNEEYSVDQIHLRNATIYAIGCNESGQCIKTAGANITYPESVIEIENTEDTGPFPWDENHLRPIDATYIVQHDADQYMNFYGESALRVNYTPSVSNALNWGEYSYLKFDVSEIPKQRILSAKLHLYVENEGDMRESVREIGVFDTYVNDWDGQMMTWSDSRVEARTQLGSFTVTATGYMIEDVGWHEVDITDYLKNDCIDDKLSLMLKSISTQAYETVITSGIYDDTYTFEDRVSNKNIPVLEIVCQPEESATIGRISCSVSSDTYISQNGEDNNTNFSDNEFLSVNYTPNASGNVYWGQDSYLSFNIDDINNIDRQYINSATLWLYVDKTSDIRSSNREISIFGNHGSVYNVEELTWSSGRPTFESVVGSFTVQGNSYTVVNPGWKQIDVTEFLKTGKASKLEFIARMTSNTQHPVKIRSGEHSNESTRPRLVIDYTTPINLSSSFTIYDITNSTSNIDSFEIIPQRTGEYIIQKQKGEGMICAIYDDERNLLSEFTSFGSIEYSKIHLTAGQTYTVEISAAENQIYSYSISLMPKNTLIAVNNSGIEFSNTVSSNEDDIKINLYDFTGALIETKSISKTFDIKYLFELDEIGTQYTIAQFNGTKLLGIYKVGIVKTSCNYNVNKYSNISVPIELKNVLSLSDIEFSICYNKDEFVLMDACENTFTEETNEGYIDYEELNVQKVCDDYLLFNSEKILTDVWNGKINTIKLQSLGEGTCTVIIYVYKVQY